MAIIQCEPWYYDPMCIRMPWNHKAYALEDRAGGKRLSLAVMWDNGIVKPHPPVTRALGIFRDAVIAAGHEGKSLNFRLVKPCTDKVSD